MKIIRVILGSIILFFDAGFRPRKMKREDAKQKEVDEQTKDMALYQFHACPFCVKVRRAIHRLNLNIELRDAKDNETYRAELLKEGGKVKVPCLKINNNGSSQWMYESSDIVSYLEKNFA